MVGVEAVWAGLVHDAAIPVRFGQLSASLKVFAQKCQPSAFVRAHRYQQCKVVVFGGDEHCFKFNDRCCRDESGFSAQ